MKRQSPLSDIRSAGEQSIPRETQTVDEFAKRRQLLKTVSGGAALLAAASPIRALANTSSCTNPCSISGMQSAHHSVKPGDCARQCGGYSPGWWGQSTDQCNSAGVCTKIPKRTWPTDYTKPVNSVLINSSLSISLFELMYNPMYANSDERHWICAWLNAQTPPPGYEFPYTTSEVINFYLGIGPYSYDIALKFFKDYMETHRS